MKILDLSGIHRLKMVGTETWIPATVPGSVFADWYAAGMAEDPFWRDQEDTYLDLSRHDFLYEIHFEVSNDFLRSKHLLLHCDGIDTLGQLFLNGTEIGSTDNMHRIWEFDVREKLRSGKNTLEILLKSPVRYIEEKNAEFFCDTALETLPGVPHIRKPHYMFGWDWGPHLPDAGIWRKMTLIGYDQVRLCNANIRQTHENGQVLLTVHPEMEGDCSDAVLIAEIRDPSGKVSQIPLDQPFAIENPQLWYPNGYGKQPLYQINLSLKVHGIEIDRLEKRIGLRQIKLSTENDAFGQEFAFVVNGIKIFAMGANYIPQDNLISRITKEKMRDLLQDCVDAHFNMIRVWGGGFYPSDEFYDLCDEFGIIVWQDMMFACAAYSLTKEFEENILAEFRDNIKRFRHHACLGLICGNNEIEDCISHGSYKTTPKQLIDYHFIFEYLIPRAVETYAPDICYRPSSPSSGGYFDEPNDYNRGDTHYWWVWHGGLPFSDYRKYFFRFCSEFGFQSFPSWKTVESFTLPQDRNVFSYVMEKHQRNAGANSRILQYLEQQYLMPEDLDRFIYLSQLLQADAIRYGVEHWRRNRGRCMGAIYWQLNDCWPVASWSSIDYYGRWKALHYAAKRFFAPILLSCEEEGMLTQNPNVNIVKPIERSIRLNLSNETLKEITAKINWSLRGADSEIKEEHNETITVPALSSVWLEKVVLKDADLFEDHVSFTATVGGKVVSAGSVLFSLPKYYHFRDPRLSVSVSGDTVTVTSDAYVKGVAITNENDDLILEDNYFDMEKGCRTLRVIRGSTEKLLIRSLQN